LQSRRDFLKSTSLAAAAFACSASQPLVTAATFASTNDLASPNYTLRIKSTRIEVDRNHFLSTTVYNEQFPGPLLRFKEGQRAVVDIFNDTHTPEQLHWHGQKVSTDVDGAAEEGTPYIPAHGKRRIAFTPNPAGFRFYHSHNRAGSDLAAGQYTGQVGPIYIEPKDNPGRYDREIFLVLKEFEPALSQGGDMPQDFLSPSAPDPTLKQTGESSMQASLAKGMPHGYEVGYKSFTINGRMFGHGEPIRVKRGERVLFHILNGSATEIRSIALPGHVFQVIALDGNPVPNPSKVPVLWLGTAERISTIVEMDHPGVWILGDLAEDDRHGGMAIVIEYAGRSGKPAWIEPPPFRWNYSSFAKRGSSSAPPDETFDMLFAKDNAAASGFNRWTINGIAYPMDSQPVPASFHLKQGRRYRIRMRNASDDIHPIHLHRHSFELTKVAGISTAGVMKDVVMLGGYQQAEIDFVADNPGLTLFHCHQQLHMDFGFMTLFDYK
jgi:FtsP/CotA-like multicopper oxidase with cupredoxin domain